MAAMAVGLLLAAWGIGPALTLSAGASAADRASGVRTYVVERLPHHLLLRSFPEPMVTRHLLAVLVWWLLARLVPPTAARRRAVTFTLAAVAFSLAGFIITLAEPLAPGVSLELLRFYWFRLADVLVPLALAVAAALVVADDTILSTLLPRTAWAPSLVRAGILCLLAAELAVQSSHWPLPGRAHLVPRADAKVNGPAWADACAWVRDHVPADACFLTPRGAASFTWRTGRREVVSWKNSPQDARSLLEWRRRILDCFSPTGRLSDLERSTAALGGERMREVADRYGAGYAIVPTDLPGLEDLPFERLHANDSYVVLDLGAKPTAR